MYSFPPETNKRIQEWLHGPFDEGTKQEIHRLLKENPQELCDAFSQDLSFGTGGMRELMGVGTCRMNLYTIRSATQGLANYLKTQKHHPLSVLIGYDTRHHSKEFAQEAASVLAGNEISVKLLKDFCPTPFISFCCRYLHCSAAIMITASHNPPQYNGYKVYWKDGAQVVFPHDQKIVEEIKKKPIPRVAPLSSSWIESIETELDPFYLKELHAQPLLSSTTPKSLKIIYTSLHGTGIRLTPQALRMQGFSCLSLVKEQISPDGNFPFAPSPNPEEEKALELGTKQLLQEKGHLLLATDPDADRVGAVIRHQDQAIRFTGNQMACLMADYIGCQMSLQKPFSSQDIFIKTIVTTELFKKIVESFHARSIDVLTGFKYIGEKIALWESQKSRDHFIFGAEESYGYLLGTFVRDKDAISSSCLIAAMVDTYLSQNTTLLDRLYFLYETHGIHREKVSSLDLRSLQGAYPIQQLMESLRKDPLRSIHNTKISSMDDYLKEHPSFPKSNILTFWLDPHIKLIIRPSGTEPKVKLYGEIVRPFQQNMSNEIKEADEQLSLYLDAFRQACLTRLHP